MPPIRSESGQKSANQEYKILLALNDIKNGRVKYIRTVVKLYEIPHTTLAGRVNGIEARIDKQPNGHKLT